MSTIKITGLPYHSPHFFFSYWFFETDANYSRKVGLIINGRKNNMIILEGVPKCQIAFESKAQADEKAQSATHSGGWAIKRPSTQLFRRRRTRWGFETTSKNGDDPYT
jgi:hypothetical protein